MDVHDEPEYAFIEILNLFLISMIYVSLNDAPPLLAQKSQSFGYSESLKLDVSEQLIPAGI
jgi:hypothetical protein